MKLHLDRETLLQPLQRVIGVVERKQTLPVLANVLVQTKDNILSITGTDLEVELIGQSNLGASTENHAITLPGRKLMDICKSLPENAPIELYQEKEKMILKSGRSRFTLSTLPAADFPNSQTEATNISLEIQQTQLKELLQRTYFAIAQQDVRYYLNGLLLEIQPDSLRAVATDGHRLATAVVQTTTGATQPIQVIVPRKGISELLRLLDDNEKTLTLSTSGNHIRIATEDFVFTSKLIEGRFPNYEQVIPKNNHRTITLDVDELKQALTRSAILCNEKFRGIRLELGKNKLKISSNNPQQEAAEEELKVDYAQEELSIGFNVNYLLDALNTIGAGVIKLNFADSNSSLLIEEVNNPYQSYFVVMPLRL